MLMFVVATCIRPPQSTALDTLPWHSVVCSSSALPHYMLFTQGTPSSPLPVEIVCFLLCHLNLVQQNSTWIMVAARPPHFAPTLCVQSMFSN